MTAHNDQWKAALSELQLQMTRATFDTWLRSSRLIEAAGDTWTVSVRHAYAMDWLNNRLLPTIERTASRIAGHRVQVRFVIAPPEPAEPPPAGDEPEPEPTEPAQILDAVSEDHVTLRDDGTTLCYTDFYIRLKLAFRDRMLRELRGARLSVFLCLALHVDRYSVSSPGVTTIMKETGYGSRHTVCEALDSLESLNLIEKLSPGAAGQDRYRVRGYAWFGRTPNPALFELSAESALPSAQNTDPSAV